MEKSTTIKKPWWMCTLEEYFWKHEKWELIHDGQRNPGQFEFPPEDVRRFTRRYRKRDFGVKFLYDLRQELAEVEFEFYKEGLNHKKMKDTGAINVKG